MRGDTIDCKGSWNGKHPRLTSDHTEKEVRELKVEGHEKVTSRENQEVEGFKGL